MIERRVGECGSKIEECGACSCNEDGDVAGRHEGDTME